MIKKKSAENSQGAHLFKKCIFNYYKLYGLIQISDCKNKADDTLRSDKQFLVENIFFKKYF